MLATEHLEPQVSHCRKKSRVSFWRIVSGERHVWHVTYSLMYLLRTFSICFCWKRPLMINWLFPSTEPLVPNSASKKSNKCFGCLCNVLQICKRDRHLPLNSHFVSRIFFTVSTYTQYLIIITKSCVKCIKIYKKSTLITYFGKISERRFLCSNAHYLWWAHNKLLFFAGYHVGILLSHNIEHTIQ